MAEMQVSLQLTAEDLATPQIRRVITQVERLQASTARLGDMQRGAGASGMVRFSRDTQQASQTMGTFGQILQQAFGVAGGIGIADVVTAIAQGLVSVSSQAITANASLQRMQTTLRAFTRDPALADAMTAMLRANADVTPFGTAEVMAAGTQLVPIARTTESLERAVRLAERLAVLNPEQGLRGAAFALREAAGGDYVSLQERFNVPRTLINQLRGQGFTGLDLATEALRRMGVTWDLVEDQGRTFEGRVGTITSALQELARVAAEPTFQVLAEQQARAAQALEQNRPGATRVAGAAGGIFAWLLGGMLQAAEDRIHGVTDGLVDLAAIIGRIQALTQDRPSLLDALIPPADRAALAGPPAGLGGLLAGPLATLADAWRRLQELDAAFYGRGRTTVSTLLGAGEQRAGERSGADYAATQRATAAATWLRTVQRIQDVQRAGERAPGTEAGERIAAYQRALIETQSASADLFTRHTAGWTDVAASVTAATQKVGQYALQLSQLGQARGFAEGLRGELQRARTLERRLGTYGGEYDAAIRDLYRREHGYTLAEGTNALQEYLAARLREQLGGEFGSDRLSVGEQHVTAQNVYVNGQAVGGGAPGAISGSGLPTGGVPRSRYDQGRGAWVWTPGHMGIGRAIG